MRLSPRWIWRAHLNGLTRHPTDQPDWTARSILYGLPALVAVIMFIAKGELRQPAALLAGASLLAGTLLASFGQLATLRGRLMDKGAVRAVALDALDETAAHVLMAVYAAIGTAAMLGAATSLATGAVRGLPAALAISAATWLGLLVLLVVPRLYQAYTYAFRVRPGLNGYDASSDRFSVVD